MNDIHIDDFYKDCGKVLLSLYNSFPRKITLYVEDICGPDTLDEFGLHSRRHLACLGSIQWLADQGYLYYQDLIRQEAVESATLTHKTFTLLTAPIGALDETYQTADNSLTNHVGWLRHAVRNRSSMQLQAVMQQLLNQSRHHR